MQLLPIPDPIEVVALIPDYPPALFTYKGKVHRIKLAEGPERMEQPWWSQNGEYRDYYCLEDFDGLRFWVFRLGDYNARTPEWFIHGFFA